MARAQQVRKNMMLISGLRGVSWRDFPPAFVLFLVALWVWAWWEQHERDRAPPSEYLEVRQVSVPNHPVGTDPKIVYDRTIHRDFRGTWTAQIQRAGDLKDVCVSDMTQNYFKDKPLPEGGATLSWFMFRECKLPVGVYRLHTCWEIYREQAIPTRFCYTSEVFNVFDPQQLLEQQ